jgi:hypothetical protein
MFSEALGIFNALELREVIITEEKGFGKEKISFCTMN